MAASTPRSRASKPATASAAAPPEIIVNLDTLERGKSYTPFTIAIGDRVITMNDAAEIPWQQIQGLDNPLVFFDLCMPEEDKQFFLGQQIPGWKLHKILDAYLQHYEIGDLGNFRGSSS